MPAKGVDCIWNLWPNYVYNVKDKLHLHEDKLNTSIYFTSHSAQYGSADLVADETYFDVCGGDQSTVSSTVTSSLCMKQFSFL